MPTFSMPLNVTRKQLVTRSTMEHGSTAGAGLCSHGPLCHAGVRGLWGLERGAGSLTGTRLVQGTISSRSLSTWEVTVSGSVQSWG